MATRSRRRRFGSDKDQAAKARAGQAACSDLLRSTEEKDGVRYEQRCIGELHGNDVRHHPGPWVEIDSSVF